VASPHSTRTSSSGGLTPLHAHEQLVQIGFKKDTATKLLREMMV
jgi:hypothetical protein